MPMEAHHLRTRSSTKSTNTGRGARATLSHADHDGANACLVRDTEKLARTAAVTLKENISRDLDPLNVDTHKRRPALAMQC